MKNSRTGVRNTACDTTDSKRSDATYCCRKHQKNAARATKRSANQLEFIGVDGEGVTTPLGEHKYVLFGIGSKQIEDSNGLLWETIFEHLWNCFLERPDAVYAGFFLGYDFAQWFKSFPHDKAAELFTNAGKIYRLLLAKKRKPDSHYPVPVYIRGKKRDWFIDGIGERVIRISADKGKKKRWIYVNDAGPFFQTSLLNVIDPAKWDVPICTQQEYEVVKKGKSERGKPILDDNDRYYNRLENDILSRLLARYNEGLVKQGISLGRSQWYGPGRAANEWLKQRDKDNGECSIRKDSSGTGTEYRRGVADALGKFWDLCIESYFAGWFEITVHGHIRGVSYEYDINSAYPSIMAGLPCLIHGQWREGTRSTFPNRPSPYVLVRCRVYGSNPYLGAMLHRAATGDRLCRPNCTAGVYWWREIQASKRAGFIDQIEIIEWWEYVPDSRCKFPLRDIRRLYDHRLSIDKDSAEGKACKLIYNSAYGKCAQSVGNPAFANPFYASYITMGCRVKILDAIGSHPNGAHDVLMVATDAVFFRHPHPGLPLSDKLGEWSMEEKHNLTIFKPGHYWDDKAREAIANGESARFKARGVNAAAFSRVIGQMDDRFRRWDRNFRNLQSADGFTTVADSKTSRFRPQHIRQGFVPRRLPQNFMEWPMVKYPVNFSMVTIGQALQWNDWSKCGMVETDKIVGPIKSDPSAKRDYRDDGTGSTYDCNGKLYRSHPYPFAFRRSKYTSKQLANGEGYCSYELENTPYSKQFGLDREEAWQNEFGISPDGPLGLLVLDAIGEGKLKNG